MNKQTDKLVDDRQTFTLLTATVLLLPVKCWFYYNLKKILIFSDVGWLLAGLKI